MNKLELFRQLHFSPNRSNGLNKPFLEFMFEFHRVTILAILYTASDPFVELSKLVSEEEIKDAIDDLTQTKAYEKEIGHIIDLCFDEL